MIRVVITGSECAGKTTLAAALADKFGAPWVPEFARRFVDAKGAPVERDDVELIARGQAALEDEIAATKPELLVLDTDLISTVVYARHAFGGCAPWIERAARRRRGDLYLLAGIEVPWMPDEHQRTSAQSRGPLQELFRQALRTFEANCLDLHGTPGERLGAAAAAVEGLRHPRTVR